MVNSTEEYWDVDGVSLQTLVQNLSSWGADREGVPDLRGSDAVIPSAPGERFMAKQPGARTITLDGWLTGAKETLTPLYRNLAWNPALAGGTGILAQQVVDGSDPGAAVTNVLAGQDLSVVAAWPVAATYDGGTPAAGGLAPFDGGTPAGGTPSGDDGGNAVEDKVYQLDGGVI